MSAPDTFGAGSPSADNVVAAFSARLDDMKRRRDAARSAMENASAAVTSPDGIVSVDVSAAGRVLALRLRSDVDRLDGPQLSASIVRTVREGTVRALGIARLGVAEAVGESSAAITVLRREIDALSVPGPATQETRPGRGDFDGD